MLVLGVVVLLGGSLMTWSSFAPLARGAIAPGVISVESIRKSVQHFEGGIISAIHVQDGDVVAAGDPLITLDSMSARANVEVLRTRLDQALAQEARLIAQRDGGETISFPRALLDRAGDAVVADILRTQIIAFDAQRQTLLGRRDIINERIRQSQREIEGLEAQIAAFEEQLRLISLEETDVQFLIDQGLERRPRLLALQRSASQLVGEIESNRAGIAQINQRIAESELQILDLVNAQRDEAVDELRLVQERLGDTRNQLHAAEDVVERLVARAPNAGIVVDLQFHTVGGVVRPGERMMDVVPVDDDLIIVAQVNIANIDVVRPGTSAEVILSALDQRSVPRLDGEVITVSADRLTDERTGMAYYEARVRIDRERLSGLDVVDDLYPGMPADVVLVTGERTVLEYLVSPLTSSFERGFVAE